jgi:hypothetical protein
MNKLLSIILVTILVSFSACSNSDRDRDNSTQAAQEFWISTNHFTNIFREVHRVAIVDSIIAGRGSSAIYPEVCLDSFSRSPNMNAFPIDLSIFYGINHTCEGERNRSGKLVATFDKVYPDSGSIVTITTVDYQIDGFIISAEMEVKITSSTPWLVEFDVTVKNGKIINTNEPGTKISLAEAKYKISSVDGMGTITTSDDDFKFDGSGNGMASNGVTYTCTSETTTFLFADCNYESSGSFRIKAPNQQDRICNFNEADGAGCNSKMVVYIPPTNGDIIVEIP